MQLTLEPRAEPRAGLAVGADERLVCSVHSHQMEGLSPSGLKFIHSDGIEG